MSPIIRTRELWKTYETGQLALHALRNVSVDIDPGEFVAITGPSGSGKSTFMHVVGCLDQVSSGRYWLEGRDVSALTRDELAEIRNARIGFVFQGFNLLPRKSAVLNVELPLFYTAEALTTSERRRRAMASLATVGLEDHAGHRPNQMSGGQQQRVAIARALVTQPTLLLADEPTGNLDTRTSFEVLSVFQHLNTTRGITVLLVTHELDIAQCAMRIISFRDGEIVADHPVSDRHDALTMLANLPPPAAAVSEQRR